MSLLTFFKRSAQFFALLLLMHQVVYSQKAPIQEFSKELSFLDLRSEPWEYIHDTTNSLNVDDVKSTTQWNPIEVGRSWDFVGHRELRKGTVWVRTRVFIPKKLEGNAISFFCTTVGGSADLLVNGNYVGEHIVYKWSSHVPGPTKIEISHMLNFDAVNEVLVKTSNIRAIRSIGLLGLVCLQRTLPFYQNTNGGIVTMSQPDEPLSVILHYGDAVLSKGEQTAFTTSELRELKIPVYGLREEEMISVVPTTEIDVSQLFKVNVELLHSTTDKSPISVRCRKLPESMGQFDLITIPLDLEATYNNPFQPEEINVWAEISTPSGKIETVCGFFAQDYKTEKIGEFEEILLPTEGLGTPWRINYRPRDAGEYSIHLYAKDQNGIAMYDAGTVEVGSKPHKGYLKVSKRDKRYFEFDNGDSFYATGPSGWFRQTENWMFGGNTRWVPVEDLKGYYKRKAANRSNYEYLARWHFGSLYLKDGYIDAYVAWKLDAAVRSMEENGIYWITYGRPASGRTYHNQFDRGLTHSVLQRQIVIQNGLPTFDEVGYEKGGKTELYHFVSRWADSPAIWMWNCAEEDYEFNSDVLPYHSYIRSLDIYQHPHGVSEGVDGIKYGGDAIILPDWYRGSYEKCLNTYKELTDYDCPVIDIEGSVNHSGDLYDMKGYRLGLIEEGYHNHLWMCLFLKMAGGGTDWFNVELDRDGLMYHSKVISQFLEEEHLTKTRWEIAEVEVTDSNVDAYGLESKGKTLVWLIRPPATRDKLRSSSFDAKIPVAGNGKYLVEIWDTRTGATSSKLKLKSEGGFVTLKIDDLDIDRAYKIVLQ